MQGSIVAIVLTLTLGFSFVPLVTSAQQLGESPASASWSPPKRRPPKSPTSPRSGSP